VIETLNMTGIADRGLMHTNLHVTALCSPTWSWLLIGRNRTTNGMACLAEASSGLSNSNGHISMECTSAAELRGERGWIPDRPGLGVQDAVQAVEALLQLPGRHGRSDDRVPPGADHEGGRPHEAPRRLVSLPLSWNAPALSRDRVLRHIHRPVAPPTATLEEADAFAFSCSRERGVDGEH
jgi:hypothetical protein